MFSNNFNFELVANTISGPGSIDKVYEFLRKLGQQFPKAIKDFKVLVMGKTNTVNAIDYLNT